MIGIDTNVLVRYLVQDDPEQAARATRFIVHGCSSDEPCLINRVVLCELVWVLEGAYRYGRGKVSEALEGILRTAQLKVEDHQEAWTALRQYRAGSDFADALIAVVNQREGCEHTVTFDRKAARLAGFVAL